jgi:predicted MFS family arabinose efflux permease
VFAVREFRALFGTFVLSSIGDELARVALTVLVYQRTQSPLLSAVTFAISYLPWLLGGPVLAALADRLPRHRVLIATDAARAVLVAAMAVPGMPLSVLLVLLFLVSLGAPPFESARSALQADVLEGDRYALASSLSSVTLQLSQVLGFLLAGALVALSGPRGALLLDAATFVLSALWLSAGLVRRAAPSAAAGEDRSSLLQDAVDGLRLIARTPRLRAIVGLLWAGTMFTFAPEGLALPFARQLGQGTTGVGILLAANPLGVTVGAVVVGRLLGAEQRERLMAPLVVLSLLPLVGAGIVATTAGPGRLSFVAVLVLMFVSGCGAAWAIPLNVSFVQAVPAAFRGRAFGVAVTGLYGVQGLGMLAAGALAEGLSAGGVVCVAGALGLAAVALPLAAFHRTRGSVAGDRPAEGPSTA